MIEDIAASRRLRMEADRRQPTPSFLLVSTLDMAAWSSSRWTERHCGRAPLRRGGCGRLLAHTLPPLVLESVLEWQRRLTKRWRCVKRDHLSSDWAEGGGARLRIRRAAGPRPAFEEGKLELTEAPRDHPLHSQSNGYPTAADGIPEGFRFGPPWH